MTIFCENACVVEKRFDRPQRLCEFLLIFPYRPLEFFISLSFVTVFRSQVSFFAWPPSPGRGWFQVSGL